MSALREREGRSQSFPDDCHVLSGFDFPSDGRDVGRISGEG